MNVEIITDKEGKAIGWSIDADKSNQKEVTVVNTIRHLQFFGFDDTAIEYNGRTGGTDDYAGKLSWVQKNQKKDD